MCKVFTGKSLRWVEKRSLVLIPSFVLIAVGSGILHLLLITMYIELLPVDEKGRASAAFYLSFDLGVGLGTCVLSPILEWLSLREVFLIAGLVSLIGIILVRPFAAQREPVNPADGI